jgi:hypothetical protein
MRTSAAFFCPHRRGLQGQNSGSRDSHVEHILSLLFSKVILALHFISASLIPFIMNDQEAFAVAVKEAKVGYKEGGVPVSIRVAVNSDPEEFAVLKHDYPRLEQHWSPEMASC